MGLAAGTRLGAYEIVGLIGAGGMGEVYRARDTRLDRHVAIKVLPDAFRADAERAARFEREAKLLATLNHPNIAGIYGLEDSQGEQCIVMELVEGETLADRIARGPLPVAEALEIARQIADALEAAHEKGIIHRDLKPANVKLTPDDQVKVLDFGLAKAFGLDAAHVSPDGLRNSPTLTSPIAATGVGVLLGTAAYMAPEQAKGRAVDKRGDVWAFGCVLYEMLTGQCAFTGEDVSDTLASVLRGEPQWSALGPAVPERIRVLLRRCLAKERKARIPDISVARYLLEEIAGTLAEPAQPVRAPVSASRWITAAMSGAVASAAVVLLAIYYLDRVESTVRPVRLAMQVEPGSLDVTGTESLPATPPFAVSPDGSIVAFVATTRGTRSRLWIRPLDTLAPRELAGTDGASSPFWSPDSRFLGFFADGKLKKIDVNGGPSQPLCDAPQQRGGAWSPEGFIIFGSIGNGLQKVPAAGGVPTALTTLAEGENLHSRPGFLPDGRHFFYRALGGVGEGPVYIASIDSGDRKPLIERPAASNVAYASGHLLFLRETTLMAQPFDVGTQTLTGEPVPIAADIRTFNSPPVGFFSVSQTGVLAYQTGSSASVGDLTWFDRTGKPLGTVGEPAAYADVELSPDDKRVVVSIGEQGQSTRDIWMLDVARGLKSRFTFDATSDDTVGTWSPDGSRIIFSSRKTTGSFFNLYEKASNLAGTEQLLWSDSSNKYPMRWSHDGRFVPVVTTGSSTGNDLWVLPLTGDRKPFPFLTSAFNDAPGQLSPDSRWMAYQSNEGQANQIYVTPFPGPGGKVQVSALGGRVPRWRGQEIFFLSPDSQLMVASVTVKDSVIDVGAVRPLFPTRTPSGGRYQYDVTTDGQRFLIHTVKEAASPPPITVVLNWTEEVKRLVPAN